MPKTRWYNRGDGSDFRSDLDQFLIDEGIRGLPPGKLKQFYADPDHDGWYMFIFENLSTMCTIPVGIYMGYFVDADKDSVMLNPKLEKELDESEKDQAVEKTGEDGKEKTSTVDG